MNAALISDGDVNGIPERSSIQLQRRGERLDRTSSGASDGEKQEIPAICLFLASSHTWRVKTSFIQFIVAQKTCSKNFSSRDAMNCTTEAARKRTRGRINLRDETSENKKQKQKLRALIAARKFIVDSSDSNANELNFRLRIMSQLTHRTRLCLLPHCQSLHKSLNKLLRPSDRRYHHQSQSSHRFKGS